MTAWSHEFAAVDGACSGLRISEGPVKVVDGLFKFPQVPQLQRVFKRLRTRQQLMQGCILVNSIPADKGTQ